MSRRDDSVTDFGHTLWHQKRIVVPATALTTFEREGLDSEAALSARKPWWKNVLTLAYCLKSKAQNFCTMYSVSVGGCWMCLSCLSWSSPESRCLCPSCLHFVKFSSLTWGVSSLFLCKRAQPQNVKWTWEESRAFHTVFMTSVLQRELWIDNDVT